MNKLKMLASQATSLTPLMDGREKISTEDIIKNYGTITITKVDMCNGKKGEYPVILFKENDGAFYCGGVVLKKIIKSWLEYCEDDIDKVNEMLETDPVKVMLTEGKTKDGSDVTKVTIVD